MERQLEDEMEATPASDEEESSGLSGKAAEFGKASIILMVAWVSLRLTIGGTERIGVSPFGRALEVSGFSFFWAHVLDLGNMSIVLKLTMVLALTTAALGIVLGVIALFQKGRKDLAVKGIVRGSCAAAPVVLLILYLLIIGS